MMHLLLELLQAGEHFRMVLSWGVWEVETDGRVPFVSNLHGRILLMAFLNLPFSPSSLFVGSNVASMIAANCLIAPKLASPPKLWILPSGK